ncbi:hypothetical protein R6Q59_022346 [Mikania micrantha]|uniref:RING-type domain-containing protein n=1 Tax=Mikania micrantha TaxID=192012 RepID=A0A5N6MXC7_9ASTR|nr:hypothetical protein E3N88_27281 [Mikania micrantha]KAD4178696.1 hypothetical protein E3N88_27287 [Mikania micrantha]
MAVEASHITVLPPPNREMVYQCIGSRYDDRIQTVSGSKTEKLPPMYVSGMTDSFLAPDFKSVSGLASGVPSSRKRSRDSSSIRPSFYVPNAPNVDPNGLHFGEYTFLGEDFSMQIHQQQLEIDRLIAHHNEKVRSEIFEMRKQNSRRLITAVHEAIMNKLKTKEEEILIIGQLNWSLEEKLKSLSVENQILKELVQTNEATANALRNKLQQVLAQIQFQQEHHYFDLVTDNAAKATTVLVDDAQSLCGSNYEEDDRHVAEDGGAERKVTDANNDENEDCKTTRGSSRYGGLNRWCRRCGKEESCVLLLPCRHLCVCSLCVSSVSFCPVCNSTKSAGVHVNMSSF